MTTNQYRPGADNLQAQTHAIAERDARVWSNADERQACKIILAYERFLSEKLNPATAALLVGAWVQLRGETDGYDRAPYNAK